jgi:hypothetical protein
MIVGIKYPAILGAYTVGKVRCGHDVVVEVEPDWKLI